jgi:vacuolar protein sorting-associated protein 54
VVGESRTDKQARTFLIAYHGARLTKSAKAVEEEQWTQIDVASSVQHTVDLLVSSATEDSAECFIPPRHDVTTNGNANGTLAKQLNIEEKGFFIVKATSETLELLADYLKIVINLELVVMDVMSRIIEFLKVSSACPELENQS